jgi:peptidyl-prolyl cis-trans isomerase B (cyclophilin B)
MQRKLSFLLSILSILLFATGFTLQNSATATKRPRVEIRTELGTVVVELYNETPGHRDNFLKLVKEGYYDSLLWHRIIPQFMVQGGDPNSKRAAAGVPLGSGGPSYTQPAEIVPGLIHKKGALAAARQGDQVNPTRASSGSQFYIVQGKTFTEGELKMFTERNARQGINTVYTPEQIATYGTIGGAPHLDGAYTVFGEVVQGLEVVDKLAAVERGPGDRPLTDVHMWMSVLK